MTFPSKTFSPQWVDFHCHLDLYPNHEDLIAQCDRDEVATLTVTTTPRAWMRNTALASKSKYVRVALGLHPQLVAERAAELSLWKELMTAARYIGEVGLDAGPRYYHSFELQKQVFTEILCECARVGGKVLSVHSVRSASAALDLISQHLPPDRGRVVLHWFTGSHSDARRAIDLGCYFSINAAMLRNDRHRAMITKLPLSHLLTETDGPFTKVGERAATPSDVAGTVRALAELIGIPATDAAASIRANLARVVAVDQIAPSL